MDESSFIELLPAARDRDRAEVSAPHLQSHHCSSLTLIAILRKRGRDV